MFETGFPKDWSTLKKLIWLYGSGIAGGAKWVWQLLTGTAPLTLLDAVAHPIKSLTQYGKCVQSGTPTPDAPVDILCNNGVLKPSPNLLDPSTSSITIGQYYNANGTTASSVNNWRTGLIPITGGKTYAFYGRAKADNTISAYNRINWFDANGTNISPRPTYTKFTATIATAPDNAAFVGLACSQYDSLAKITREDFDLYNWTFAETTQEIPYVPYGGVYAGGTHPGKNLANVNEQTALVGYYISASGVVTADVYNWIYQEYIRVKPSTTYTLSMSQSVYYVSISEYSKADDSGFVVRKTGSTGSNTSLTITTGATTNYIRFGTNIDRTSVTLEEVLAINWQVEEGETATAYEPYTEIPYTPEVLTVSGKNLLDPSAVTAKKYINASGQELPSQSPTGWLNHSDYIAVTVGEDYTLSVTGADGGSNTIAFNWFDENKTILATRPTKNVTSGTTAYTFTNTAPADAAYLIVNFITGTKVMAEESSIATAYEPYVAPQTVNDVPMLLGVGDYKDDVELISGIKTGKVGVMVIDGTENWALNTAADRYYLVNTSALQNGDVLCTHGPNIRTGTPTGSNAWSLRSSRAIVCFADMDRWPTAADFKAWLAEQYAKGTPVIVLYPLATETTEQTTAHSLHTTVGTNVVDVSAAVSPVQLSVEYAKQST